MSSPSSPAKKAWRTRRAKKAVETRKAKRRHREKSDIAKREVRKRKEIQGMVATRLKKWWKKEYMEGPPSKPTPLKCIVCGESSTLGLSIHHIDPNIKRGDEGYNAYENQAPVCGTCHNIITHKKSRKPEDILNEIDARHYNALRKRKLRTAKKV